MKTIIASLMLLALAVVTSAQPMETGSGRHYTGESAWDVRPAMSFGRVGNPDVIKAKSGVLFNYRLTISDKDQWKYTYTENGQSGYEIRTEEDSKVEFLRTIDSGVLTRTSTSHLNQEYITDYYITAASVTTKEIRWDRFDPSNANNPVAILRDVATDYVSIPVEISP